MQLRNTICFLLLMWHVTSCAQPKVQAGQYVYVPPQDRQDGIKTANLSAVRLDSELILKLRNLIMADSFHNVHSLLIAKNNWLVYEDYFPGCDQKHGKKLGMVAHAAEQLHDCRSVSKTVVAACIGIAIKSKLIQSINDPIAQYLPAITDLQKRSITIKHLLTMTAGLAWKEIGHYASFFNSETQMDLRFNPIKYILKKPLMAKPGTQWLYSGGNTQLLAAIIQQVSGLSIYQFADRYLFAPLGINNSEWVRLKLGKVPAAASGLRLCSRDMLKLGLLYSNQGNWNGQQILDSSWVAQTFTSYIERPDLSRYLLKNGGYGFQCWTYTDTVNGRPVQLVEAMGNGGQSIFICKDGDTVVVTTGGNYNQADDNAYRMVTKYILPAMHDIAKNK